MHLWRCRKPRGVGDSSECPADRAGRVPRERATPGEADQEASRSECPQPFAGVMTLQELWRRKIPSDISGPSIPTHSSIHSLESLKRAAGYIPTICLER